MATIALVVHQFRDEAEWQALALAKWLDDSGHSLRMLKDDADLLSLPGAHVERDEIADGVDLMVALGGDGSILSAVDLVADAGVPVLGVNFGQLGYLTEVEPGGLRSAVDRCLTGNHLIEERMRVEVRIERADGQVEHIGNALNEAIVEKIESGRTVRLKLTIDGEWFTNYGADGLIVATPTGSTAYSLSARGPIVAPTHEALIVTPVAPHMLFDRSLVLAPYTEVRVEVIPDRPAQLALDGRHEGRIEPGDVVVCTRSAVPAKFVTMGSRDFLGVLKAKFMLDGT